jgi:hypothetical protein
VPSGKSHHSPNPLVIIGVLPLPHLPEVEQIELL